MPVVSGYSRLCPSLGISKTAARKTFFLFLPGFAQESQPRVLEVNSEGVREFQPKVSTLGNKRKARPNAESVGKTGSRCSPTLAAFAGSLDGLPQGIAALQPWAGIS